MTMKRQCKIYNIPQQRGNVHVERIQNQRMLKQTATVTMEETKKKGRPCKKQKDKFEENLNVMGIKNWPTMVRDHWE